MDRTKIVINGVELTEGQAMTIHVALQNFAIDLKSKKGNLGEPLNSNYLRIIKEINNISAKAKKNSEMVDDDEEMECGSDFSSDFTPHVDKKIKDVCYQCSSWNKKSGKGYYKCLGTSGCPVGRIAYKEPRG